MGICLIDAACSMHGHEYRAAFLSGGAGTVGWIHNCGIGAGVWRMSTSYPPYWPSEALITRLTVWCVLEPCFCTSSHTCKEDSSLSLGIPLVHACHECVCMVDPLMKLIGRHCTGLLSPTHACAALSWWRSVIDAVSQQC